EGVQALVEDALLLRHGLDVDRTALGVDDRGGGDADFGADVGAVEHVTGMDHADAGRGVEAAVLPKDAVVVAPRGAAGSGHGGSAVVLRGDEDDVVNALAGDVDVGQHQRLGVNLAVNRHRIQPAEGVGVDVGRGQDGFVEVGAGAGVVGVVGE